MCSKSSSAKLVDVVGYTAVAVTVAAKKFGDPCDSFALVNSARDSK